MLGFPTSHEKVDDTKIQSSLSSPALPQALPFLPIQTKKPIYFGFTLNSEIVRIRITRNDEFKNQRKNVQNQQNISGKIFNHKMTMEKTDFFCVSLIVKNPVIEFYRFSSLNVKKYLSLSFGEFSIFELNENEARSSLFSENSYYKNGNNFHNKKIDIIGNESNMKRNIDNLSKNDDKDIDINDIQPFLFSSSFGKSYGNELNELEQTDNLLVKKRNENRPLVLLQISSIETISKSIKLPAYINENKIGNKISCNNDRSNHIDINNDISDRKCNHNDKSNSLSRHKNISIFLEINDITLKHDPRSSFLKNVADVLTPTSPKIIIRKQKEREEKMRRKENRQRFGNKFYEKNKNNKYREGKNHKDNNNDNNNNDNNDSDDDNDRNDNNKSSNVIIIPYTVSKINVKINKFYLDFLCNETNSRTFLTFGHITSSSTIVSNSEAFSFKFSAKDFILYLSNQIVEFPLLEQVPLNVFGNRLQLTNSNNSLHMKKTKEPLFECNKNNTIINNNKNNKNNENNFKISPQSGKIKTNNITFDLDRYLDAHSFIQIITIDECSSLIVVNPMKVKGSNIDLQKNKNINESIKSESVNENEERKEKEKEEEEEKERETKEGKVTKIHNPVDLTSPPSYPPPVPVPLTFPPFSNSNHPIIVPTSPSIPTETTTPCPGSIFAPISTSLPVLVPVSVPLPAPSTAFSIDASLGLFCLYVCMDSVDVLTVRTDVARTICLL